MSPATIKKSARKLSPKQEEKLTSFQLAFKGDHLSSDQFRELVSMARQGMWAAKELARLQRGFKQMSPVYYADGSFSGENAYPAPAMDKLFKPED